MFQRLIGVLLLVALLCVITIQAKPAEDSSAPDTETTPATVTSDQPTSDSAEALTATSSESTSPDQPQTTNNELTTQATDNNEEKQNLNYGEFPEENIKLVFTGCKSSDCSAEKSGNEVDKCYDDPYYTHHSDNCDDFDDCSSNQNCSEPSCYPKYCTDKNMPWSCYSNPCTPYNQAYYRSSNYCRPYYSNMNNNFSSYPCNMGCAGYGFGPQSYSGCGYYNISKSSMENALKDSKSFERLRGCFNQKK